MRTALDAHLPEEAFGPFGVPLAAAIKPTAATALGAFERTVESVAANRDGVDHTPFVSTTASSTRTRACCTA